jgi:hypothetical protein
LLIDGGLKRTPCDQETATTKEIKRNTRFDFGAGISFHFFKESTRHRAEVPMGGSGDFLFQSGNAGLGYG